MRNGLVLVLVHELFFLCAHNAFSAPIVTENKIFSQGIQEPVFNRGSSENTKRTIEGSLLWSKSYVGLDQDQDWSPYDALLIELRNSGTETLSLSLEISDSQSHDYWTRSNQNFALPPGTTEFRFSTRPKAGESLRPGRDLDFHKIRSFVLAREASAEGAPIEIVAVRLVKEVSARERGVYAFDFGPEGSTPFPGIVPVTPSQLYSDERGFGFVEPKFWNPYRESCSVRGPDSLYQDCIMIYQGSFRMVLPNGRYRVFMNIDHPGGFWGEYPLFRRRRVKAQGKWVVDEKSDAQQALKKYFQFEKNDDFEGMDVFETYVSKLFQEKTFDVVVENGTLDLGFENSGCPKAPCFGLALSALVVFPLENSKRGEEYLAWLHKERKREFDTRFYQIQGPVRGSTSKSSVDLVPLPFERVLTQHESLELGSPKVVRVFGHVGEEIFASMAVRFHQSTPDTHLEMSELDDGHGHRIAAQDWTLGRNQWKLTRSVPDGSQYRVSERYLRVGKIFNPRESAWERVFASLRIPAHTPAGLYRGKWSLRSGKNPPLETPIELEVFSSELLPMDIPVGPFGHTVLESWWFDLERTPRARAIERMSLERLRHDGFTTFSFSPNLIYQPRSKDLSGAFDLDATEVSRVMAMAKELGFRELVGYSNVFAGMDLCTEEYSPKIFGRVFEALKAHAQREHWLPLTLILCDEPEGEQLDQVLARIKNLPRPKVDDLVKWAITTHLGQHSDARHRSLVETQSRPFVAETDRASPPNRDWVFYNNSSRFNFGFGMFDLARKSPLRMRLAWTFNQNSGNPYFALDGREDDYSWCNSTFEGDLVCSLSYYRQVLSGLRDYRRALTLKTLLSPSSRLLKDEERVESQALLDSISILPVDISDSDPRLDDLRYRMSKWIEKISGTKAE